MDKTLVFGVILLFLGLAFISYITFRSRAIIRHIAKGKTANTREILKDLNHGK